MQTENLLLWNDLLIKSIYFGILFWMKDHYFNWCYNSYYVITDILYTFQNYFSIFENVY